MLHVVECDPLIGESGLVQFEYIEDIFARIKDARVAGAV